MFQSKNYESVMKVLKIHFENMLDFIPRIIINYVKYLMNMNIIS